MGTSVEVAVGFGVAVGVSVGVGVFVEIGVGVGVGVAGGTQGSPLLFKLPWLGLENVIHESAPSGFLPNETFFPGLFAYGYWSIRLLSDDNN